MSFNEGYGCTLGKGGDLFEILIPPPPSGPPKVFEAVFLQIEILGKMGGAAGTEIFLVSMRHALKLLNPHYVCILEMHRRLGGGGIAATTWVPVVLRPQHGYPTSPCRSGLPPQCGENVVTLGCGVRVTLVDPASKTDYQDWKGPEGSRAAMHRKSTFGREDKGRGT